MRTPQQAHNLATAERLEEYASRGYAIPMLFDSQSLAGFYDSPLGLVTRRLVHRRMRRLWPDTRAARILGYGFAIPYLRAFALDAERVIAFIPEQQGEIRWPLDRSLSTLGEEGFLPFPDACFDRVVMVHAVEAAESVRSVMRQVWRVMAPEGRLMIVAPNRASLWAQVDRSPFAHGRPFSRTQLDQMLRDAMFFPEQWDTALLLPPLKSRRLIGTGMVWERAGRLLWSGLAGVHIVDATKSLCAGVPIPAGKRARSTLAVARG